jgi:hypothetical protein
LKGERKHLTHGGPVEMELVVHLHLLIWNAQEVLNNCGILRNIEENEGLSGADTPVSNTTVHHV